MSKPDHLIIKMTLVIRSAGTQGLGGFGKINHAEATDHIKRINAGYSAHGSKIHEKD